MCCDAAQQIQKVHLPDIEMSGLSSMIAPDVLLSVKTPLCHLGTPATVLAIWAAAAGVYFILAALLFAPVFTMWRVTAVWAVLMGAGTVGRAALSPLLLAVTTRWLRQSLICRLSQLLLAWTMTLLSGSVFS